MKYKAEFLNVVAVYKIYHELCEKKVIDQTVEKAITNSHSVEEARGCLFDHMRDYGTLATLKEFCDVITSEKYDGFRAMQDFGAELRRRLEQEGRCVWWCVSRWVGVWWCVSRWVGGWVWWWCVSGWVWCGGVLSELHCLGQ